MAPLFKWTLHVLPPHTPGEACLFAFGSTLTGANLRPLGGPHFPLGILIFSGRKIALAKFFRALQVGDR